MTCFPSLGASCSASNSEWPSVYITSGPNYYQSVFKDSRWTTHTSGVTGCGICSLTSAGLLLAGALGLTSQSSGGGEPPATPSSPHFCLVFALLTAVLAQHPIQVLYSLPPQGGGGIFLLHFFQEHLFVVHPCIECVYRVEV